MAGGRRGRRAGDARAGARGGARLRAHRHVGEQRGRRHLRRAGEDAAGRRAAPVRDQLLGDGARRPRRAPAPQAQRRRADQRGERGERRAHPAARALRGQQARGQGLHRRAAHGAGARGRAGGGDAHPSGLHRHALHRARAQPHGGRRSRDPAPRLRARGGGGRHPALRRAPAPRADRGRLREADVDDVALGPAPLRQLRREGGVGAGARPARHQAPQRRALRADDRRQRARRLPGARDGVQRVHQRRREPAALRPAPGRAGRGDGVGGALRAVWAGVRRGARASPAAATPWRAPTAR